MFNVAASARYKAARRVQQESDKFRAGKFTVKAFLLFSLILAILPIEAGLTYSS